VSRRGQSGCASAAATPKTNPQHQVPQHRHHLAVPASSSSARAAPSGATSQRESTSASSPAPGRPGLQVRGDDDQVDHHDRHQCYGGHALAIAFQGERLEVFPGELLVGERRTMSSAGAARWST
jgi:hypothetical protein